MPEESRKKDEQPAERLQRLANRDAPELAYRGMPNMDDVGQRVPPPATSIQAPPPPELPFVPVKPYRRGGKREE